MRTARTFEEYIGHLAAFLNGTMLPIDGVAEQLQSFTPLGTHIEKQHEAHTVSTARERFWTGPPEVRLNARELAEAIGKPVSWVHKHTSRKSGLPTLPHAKLGHELIFTVGEVRDWLQNHATTKQPAVINPATIRGPHQIQTTKRHKIKRNGQS